MKVKDLRAAIADVDDDMVVILRVDSDDEQMMCSPSSAIPDAGCTNVEAFVIDGRDGDTQGENVSGD